MARDTIMMQTVDVEIEETPYRKRGQRCSNCKKSRAAGREKEVKCSGKIWTRKCKEIVHSKYGWCIEYEGK